MRSGLCGLLGDAVVQMVDVGDEDRLREVQALYVGYTLEKELLVNALSTQWQVLDSKRPRKYGGKNPNGLSSPTCGSRHETTGSTFLGRRLLPSLN